LKDRKKSGRLELPHSTPVEVTKMSLPLKPSDIAFEDFLQELPPEYWTLAIEFKAFCRSRKIKTPAQLMQVVMSYCGLDQVLRETAGTFTLLEEAISDTAIHQRLKACLPWIKVLLSQMMGAGLEKLIEGEFTVCGDRRLDGARAGSDRDVVSAAYRH